MCADPVFEDTFRMNVSTTASLRSAFETSLSGFTKAVSGMDTAAQKIADGEVDPQQMVALNQAEILAKANALVMRSSDEVYGSLLNAKA